VTEGKARFRVDGDVAETWYRIDGDLRPGDTAAPAPLVAVHGGPGATHDYLLPLTDLADGHAVVFYDQIGNGRSTHYPERGADFWTVDLFVRELHNLVEALGIADRHHVLGSSWGGFLAQEYALTHPPGLQAMILANTAASFPDFVAEANRLRGELPPEVEATLKRHEEAGTTDDPEYEEACMVFYKRHLCRLETWPQGLIDSFDWIAKDPTVYHTMNGPSEFHVIGSIKDWQAKDRLGQIEVQTLVASGRYDEATPALQETLLAGIPNSEQALFEESSHTPFFEERERYMQVVGDWLARHD
jgi:L-proline amide hydrolase